MSYCALTFEEWQLQDTYYSVGHSMPCMWFLFVGLILALSVGCALVVGFALTATGYDQLLLVVMELPAAHSMHINSHGTSSYRLTVGHAQAAFNLLYYVETGTVVNCSSCSSADPAADPAALPTAARLTNTTTTFDYTYSSAVSFPACRYSAYGNVTGFLTRPYEPYQPIGEMRTLSLDAAECKTWQASRGTFLAFWSASFLSSCAVLALVLSMMPLLRRSHQLQDTIQQLRLGLGNDTYCRLKSQWTTSVPQLGAAIGGRVASRLLVEGAARPQPQPHPPPRAELPSVDAMAAFFVSDSGLRQEARLAKAGRVWWASTLLTAASCCCCLAAMVCSALWARHGSSDAADVQAGQLVWLVLVMQIVHAVIVLSLLYGLRRLITREQQFTHSFTW